jgi:hypothetical protein
MRARHLLQLNPQSYVPVTQSLLLYTPLLVNDTGDAWKLLVGCCEAVHVKRTRLLGRHPH